MSPLPSEGGDPAKEVPEGEGKPKVVSEGGDPPEVVPEGRGPPKAQKPQQHTQPLSMMDEIVLGKKLKRATDRKLADRPPENANPKDLLFKQIKDGAKLKKVDETNKKYRDKLNVAKNDPKPSGNPLFNAVKDAMDKRKEALAGDTANNENESEWGSEDGDENKQQASQTAKAEPVIPEEEEEEEAEQEEDEEPEKQEEEAEEDEEPEKQEEEAEEEAKSEQQEQEAEEEDEAEKEEEQTEEKTLQNGNSLQRKANNEGQDFKNSRTRISDEVVFGGF
eukprot:3447173-Rhodomonas_salina.1